MAEDIENESIRISELPETTQVDKSNDCLVISKTSDIYSTGSKSYKITPQNLLDGVGVDYTAGDNITISDSHVISATIPTASSSDLGGVKVGSGLSIDGEGVLSATGGGGGASSFSDLDDVSINEHTLANGQVPVYNSVTQKWENMNQSGGSGHTILDDEGTSLTQRDDLQFKGAYSEDDSTNEKTVVNVVREMTKAEFDELTEAEKTGLINITDDISGGLKYVKETLWENIDESDMTILSNGSTITLTDNIFDYDEVYFEGCFFETNNSTDKKITHLAVTKVMKETIALAKSKYGSGQFEGMFDVAHNFIGAGTIYASMYCLKIPTDTTLSVAFKYVQGWNANLCTLTRIIGIKYLSDSEHTYSTDEHIVGKWIDGKTLYEKTYSVAQSTSVSNTYDLPANVDKVWFNANGSFMINTGGGNVAHLGYSAGNNDKFMSYIDWSTKKLTIPTSWEGTGYITIQYTKTSI